MSKNRVSIYLTAVNTTVAGSPNVEIKARILKQTCDHGCEPRCCSSYASYLTTPQTPLPETLAEQLALVEQLEFRVGKYIRNGSFVKEQLNVNTQFQTDSSSNILNASGAQNFVGTRVGALIQSTSPTLTTALVHVSYSCLKKDEEDSSCCGFWHKKDCSDDIEVAEYTAQISLNPGVETEVASFSSPA